MLAGLLLIVTAFGLAATVRIAQNAKIGPIFAFKGNVWGDGPRATPMVDGDFLYCLGGRGELSLIVACDMPGLNANHLSQLLYHARKSRALCVATQDAAGLVHPDWLDCGRGRGGDRGHSHRGFAVTRAAPGAQRRRASASRRHSPASANGLRSSTR